MKLGEKILEYRKKKGISQEQLGEKIDVTRQTISNWELGETSPNPEQLKLLSKELGVSIDELLDNDIKNVLVEKVSNTEKSSYTILFLLKFLLLMIVIGIGIVLFYLVMHSMDKKDYGEKINETIYCELYGEEHTLGITYYELTGEPIEMGGDSYFTDILDLGKYNDAHQIFNIINDYVKKNGGSCEIIEDWNLNNIVDMQIKEETLTKNGVTVVISEKEDYDITYGESFWLEKYDTTTGSFERLNPTTENECAFNMIGYEVTPENPLELNQDWTCMNGGLDKGTYRLGKDISFNSSIASSGYYIYTEFVID